MRFYLHLHLGVALLVPLTLGCEGSDATPAETTTFSFALAEDTILEVGVDDGLLADLDNLEIASVTDPDNGTVTIAEDGSFEYQPAADFFGEDQFTVEFRNVLDGFGAPADAVVVLTVDPVNDAPWVGSAAGFARPGQSLALDLLEDAFDVEGQAIELTSMTAPSNGNATLADGVATYVPNPGFEGVDAFHFTARDESGAESEGTATVIVQPEFTGDAAVELLSVSTDGSAPNGAVTDLAVSANGRYVAFISRASNLGPAVDTGIASVYLLDREDGEISLVSKHTSGEAGNLDSYAYGVSISADGNFVAFISEATNLVDIDLNSEQDVFLYSRIDDSTKKISESVDGLPSNAASYNVEISADAKTIAFSSTATSLVATELEDENWFFYSTVSQDLALLGPSPTEYRHAPSRATLSADGRFAALHLKRHEDNQYNTFLFDRDLGTGPRAVASPRAANGRVALSANGKHYVRELGGLLRAGNFMSDQDEEILSYAGDGVSDLDGRVLDLSLAEDGCIAYSANATNIVPGDLNNAVDIFVTQPAISNISKRVNLSPSGEEANQRSIFPKLSMDGKWIVFLSDATNLDGAPEGSELQLYVVANPLAAE